MPDRVRTGLDVLLRDGHTSLTDARIGLVTNHTAVTGELVSIIDFLHRDPRFDLVRLFGPEHGVRGDAQAGDHVGDGTDAATGLPTISLYGEHRMPSADQLAGIDVMLYDLQDAGARHYTYISTLEHIMRACTPLDIAVMVLDRPNPITGLHPEGKVLGPAFTSFVGIHPMPTRHALTIGELALLMAAELNLPEPTVIACEGWRRDMWWNETGLPFVFPSLNLPTPDSLLVYTATCIFEATSCSEGRGSTRPFELVGAPWIDATAWAGELNMRALPGVIFRPTSFVPWFSKHTDAVCHGVQLHITDRDTFRPVSTGVHMVHALMHLPESQFAWLDGPVFGMSHSRLYGSTELQSMLAAGATAEEIIARWQPELAAWVARARGYHLYA